MKGRNADDHFWCQGRALRWTNLLGAGSSPFRLGGHDLKAPEFCLITCHVVRDGAIWEAAAELPKQEHFSDEYEYLACAIALIDISVDEGVKSS